MLSKILRQPANIDKLKSDYEAALARQESAKGAWGDALLADLDGGVAAAEVDRLEKELNRSMAEAAQAKARLDSAVARASKAESDAADANLRASWKRAVALAEDRTRSAERIARLIESFADEYRELMSVTANLADALPKDVDVDAVFLRQFDMDTLIKKEFYKHDVNWAYKDWPWGKAGLPEFPPQFQGAEALVKAWAGAALNRMR